MPLDEEQQIYLTAAQGFCEIGMHFEANEELDRVDPFCRHLPEVLSVRVEIYRALGKWELMQAVAKKLVEYDPGNLQAWVSWAYATRRADSIEAARIILVNASQHHAEAAIIHFNLACYQCQLGESQSARQSLKYCFEIDPQMRVKALDDSDLELLWSSLLG